MPLSLNSESVGLSLTRLVKTDSLSSGFIGDSERIPEV